MAVATQRGLLYAIRVKDLPATMTSDVEVLGRKATQTVFRRRFIKRDGREMLLYGHAPHGLPALPEAEPDAPGPKGGELRYHPLRREWNVYAAHRQNRTFKPSAADNPLAPTRPDGAPTEIPFADFELVVFENRFASFSNEAPEPAATSGIEAKRALGRCDVVVYSSRADGSLATIGQDRRRLLVSAWIDRYESLLAAGADFVLPFENRGDAVGVTLHHPHGQIYTFPFTPRAQQDAAAAFAEGYDLSRAIETSREDFAVAEAGGLVAWCPPFARFPYEVWIAPRARRAGPWAFNAEEEDGFAALLGDITRRYDAYFGCATPYMLTLHAAPRGAEATFHFTAQFYPLLRAPGRIKFLASVEQATGAFTVDVMPDAAARALRPL
jgi:UDPglucose--hexose-1-phosphate uridylyltransferase